MNIHLAKRFRHAVGSCFVLAATVFVMGAAETPSEADDLAAIRAINGLWEEAYGGGSIEALRVLYNEESVVTPRHDTTYKGTEAIMGYFKAGAEIYDISIRLEEEETMVYGDMAHTMGLFWIEAMPKDGVEAEAFSDAGRYLILLKRDADGVWKVFRDIDQHTLDTAEATGE